MNDVKLDCFVNIVKLGSVEAAARNLFLSPQAVWKYTSDLEKELHVTLFKKGTHDLTRAGEHYFYIFEEHLHELFVTKERLRLYYEGLTHSFSIGFSEWLNPFGELDFVRAKFHERHPKTHISEKKFSNINLYQALSAHQIDIAFIPSQHLNQEKNLCVQEIATESLCFYISASGAKNLDTSSMQTCFDLPYVWAAPYPVSWLEQQQLQQQDFRKHGIVPRETIILKNAQSICTELEFSNCCTIAGSKYSACQRIPGIQTWLLPEEIKICCLFDPTNENPLIQEFIEIAKEIL